MEAEEEKEAEAEVQFFDARDDISSLFESCPGSPAAHLQSSPTPAFLFWGPVDSSLGNRIGKLDSVQERRQRFMAWMKLGGICSSSQHSVDFDITNLKDDTVDEEMIMSDRTTVLRSAGSDNGPSTSSWSSDASFSPENRFCLDFHYRIKNLDDGTVYVVDQLGEDGMPNRLRELGSNRRVTIDEFHQRIGPSAFVQDFMRREDNMLTRSRKMVKRRRMGWLKKLGIAACIVHRQEEDDTNATYEADQSVREAVCRVKVRPVRKHFKQFSAVYSRQDIKAHSGAILTMKFSPDGRYLATGGEDGVVRVWHVTTCERTCNNDVPKGDPSCMYFILGHDGGSTPIFVKRENKNKSKGMKISPNPACVVIPAEVFRISKKPLHEFHGHTGDVLDLSWSCDNYLLSSSTDRTTCLWRVGCDSFMKVFRHSNYVTCVQFNPVDENYFVSGSLDGKVRIWDISGHRVVDWIDAREIVTAVCYYPDGKGVVVGTFTGHCLFYDSSDNQLQLDNEVLLRGKKKSACCRITGFQFCPGNSQKLMVTSADSQVRILNGVDIICKYKGLRNGGSQISASFSADGRYIVSASEDSNVCIWNNVEQDGARTSNVKKIWSHERFLSENVSVAISWQPMESRKIEPVKSQVLASQDEGFGEFTGISTKDSYCHSGNNTSLPSSTTFGLRQSFLLDLLPKGSATWPEEKLPSRSWTPSAALRRSPHKLLRTSCRRISTSPHDAWGRVIVTAGWDGRIRSFQNYGLPVLA